MAIPTFGQSGEAVKAYQTQLNNQFSGQQGYVPIKADGIFGAQTQAASKFKTPSPITPLPSSVSPKMDFGGITGAPSIQGSLVPPPNTPVDPTPALSYAQLAQQGFEKLDSSQNQTNQNDAFSQLLKDMNSGANKGADVATANEQFGVNKNRQQVQDYANQIFANTTGTVVDKLSVGQNVGGITSNDRQNFESEIDRTRAIKALTLGAQLQAAQGNLSVATDIAKQAIDAKYEPIEKRLENLKTFLTLNKDNLDRDQQKQIAITNAKIKDLEVKKTDEKALQTMGLTLMQNQAPQSLMNKVNKAGSIKEIMAVPGISKYLLSQSDRLDIAIKSATLQEKRDSANAAAQARASGQITAAQAEKATDLRKEYNGLEPVKSLDKSETDTKAILNAIKGAKPTDDIAAINSFQRIAVDPGVSVREGDVALLQTANSFGDKTWLKTNGYMVGNKLTPAARDAMQDLVLKIHDSRIGSATEKTAPIRAIAKVYNVDFDTYIASPKKNSQQLLEEVTKQQIPTEQKATTFVSGIKSQMFGGSATGTPFDSLFNKAP